MNETEARTFRAAWEAAVKRYGKMTRPQLITEYAAALEADGMQHVYYGGPVSKDELIAGILNLRGYTIARQNESMHVLYHEMPWPDCLHCQAGERPLLHLNRHDLAILASSGDAEALTEWQLRK